MPRVISTYRSVFNTLSTLLGEWCLPIAARFTFAAALLMYFWTSAKTKLGEGLAGIFMPDFNAYVQIFPLKAERLGYDINGFTYLDQLVVLAGTWGEFILPALIVIGLFTRGAALGMMVFIGVQTYVDITGHGVGGADLGAWFDAPSGSLIMDQRLFWMFVLLVLLKKGAGKFSLDHILRL